MIESFLQLALALPVVTLLALPILARRREILQPLVVVSAIASFVVVTATTAMMAASPAPGFLLVVDAAWIPSLGARFRLAVDGLGMIMLWITAFSILVATAAAARGPARRAASAGSALPAFGGILFFQIAAYGLFMARDLLLFYLCLEALLAPLGLAMLRGGGETSRRRFLKFLLTHLVGSLALLLALAALMVQSWSRLGVATFDLALLRSLEIEPAVQAWIFAGLVIGFLIRAAAWPLHLWSLDAAPDAAAESSILTLGVLVKAGCFGLLTIAFPLCPAAAAAFRPWGLSIAAVGLVLAALSACAQAERSRAVAAWSAAWIGLAVVAIFARTSAASGGAVLLMAAHTVAFGGLLYLLGILERRGGEDKLAATAGLMELSPWLAGLAGAAILSASAAPFTVGFAAVLVTLHGIALGSLPAFVLVLPFLFISATAGLRLFYSIVPGTPAAETRRAWRAPAVDELLVLILVALLLVAGGLFPWRTLLAAVEPAITALGAGARS